MPATLISVFCGRSHLILTRLDEVGSSKNPHFLGKELSSPAKSSRQHKVTYRPSGRARTGTQSLWLVPASYGHPVCPEAQDHTCRWWRQPSRDRTCSLMSLYFLDVAMGDYNWHPPEQWWSRVRSSSLVAAITSSLSSHRRQGVPLLSSVFSMSLLIFWFILRVSLSPKLGI